MDDLKISIQGNITQSLRNLSNQIQDMTPVFKDIADLEWSQTKLRFNKQQDPDGKKWPDPFTLRKGTGPETGSGKFAKTKGWDYVVNSNFKATPPGYRFFDASRGDKILRDTGTLFNSIGRAYGPDYAIVGTNISYAPKLQNGRFPFLGINIRTLRNVNFVVNKYMKGLGFK